MEVVGFDISTTGRIGYYGVGSYGTISNCLVHDVTSSDDFSGNGGAGIDILGNNWTIYDNIIRNIDAAAITGHAITHGIYIAGANALVRASACRQ